MTNAAIDFAQSAKMDALLESHAINIDITYHYRTAGDYTFLGFVYNFLWEMKDLGWDHDFSQVPLALMMKHANAMEKVYDEGTAGDNTWLGMLFLFAQDVLNYLNRSK